MHCLLLMSLFFVVSLVPLLIAGVPLVLMLRNKNSWLLESQLSYITRQSKVGLLKNLACIKETQSMTGCSCFLLQVADACGDV